MINSDYTFLPREPFVTQSGASLPVLSNQALTPFVEPTRSSVSRLALTCLDVQTQQLSYYENKVVMAKQHQCCDNCFLSWQDCVMLAGFIASIIGIALGIFLGLLEVGVLFGITAVFFGLGYYITCSYLSDHQLADNIKQANIAAKNVELLGKAANQQVASLQDVHSSYQVEITKLVTLVTTLTDKLKESRASVLELKQNSDALQKVVHQLTEAETTLNAKLDEQRTTAQTLGDDLKELQTQHDHLLSTRTELQKQLAGFRTENTALLAQGARVEQSLKAGTDELEKTTEKAAKKIQVTTKALSDRNASLQRGIGKAVTQINESNTVNRDENKRAEQLLGKVQETLANTPRNAAFEAAKKKASEHFDPVVRMQESLNSLTAQLTAQAGASQHNQQLLKRIDDLRQGISERDALIKQLTEKAAARKTTIKEYEASIQKLETAAKDLKAGRAEVDALLALVKANAAKNSVDALTRANAAKKALAPTTTTTAPLYPVLPPIPGAPAAPLEPIGATHVRTASEPLSMRPGGLPPKPVSAKAEVASRTALIAMAQNLAASKSGGIRLAPARLTVIVENPTGGTIQLGPTSPSDSTRAIHPALARASSPPPPVNPLLPLPSLPPPLPLTAPPSATLPPPPALSIAPPFPSAPPPLPLTAPPQLPVQPPKAAAKAPPKPVLLAN